VFHTTEKGISTEYHILPEPLFQGSFGVIRQAVNRKTHEVCAVKTIPKSDVLHTKYAQSEVDALKCLSHPHVLKLREVYESEISVNLVTPLYTGGELFDRILQAKNSRESSLSEREAAFLARQMLQAVAYCHGQGVVHRDIKPENFVFESKTQKARLILIDFGLSRKFSLAESPKFMNTVLGSPYYAAPEVIAGKYTFKCDVWSVGIIVYTMLCGSFPFYEDDGVGLAEQIQRKEIAFEEPSWANISSEAKSFVRRLLCKNDTKRPSAEQTLSHSWIRANVWNSFSSDYLLAGTPLVDPTECLQTAYRVSLNIQKHKPNCESQLSF